MIRNTALTTALALAILAGTADFAASDHPAPSRTLLEQLKRQHDRSNWLRVTSDSLRWEVRAREITGRGLLGITSTPSSPPAPDPIRWQSIARIDQVRSHALAGGLAGGVSGAVLGGLLVWMSQNFTYQLSPTGIAVGAGIGALTGVAAGRNVKSERLVYEAPTEGIEDVGDTLQASASPQVSKALSRLRPERRLRLEGDFGKYEGYASRLGPQGFEGIRLDPSEPPRPALEHVGWERIRRVEQQGTAARSCAIVGGVIGGIGLGLAGAWLGAWSESEGGHGGLVGGAIVGAFAGAAGGAALGAVTGAAIPTWHKVYERR